MEKERESVPNSASNHDAESDRIILGLLESVGRDGAQSQRRLASELGIALGLVNAYIRRCVKKGLVKMSDAPARRYAYYLTPQGLAEKSRLTVEYLSASFSFFRRAKSDCARIFDEARARGHKRVILAGVSDLAEIAALCALESGIEIAGVVDERSTQTRFVGLPVSHSPEDIKCAIDAVVVTDIADAAGVAARLAAYFDANRIFIPALLMRSGGNGEAA